MGNPFCRGFFVGLLVVCCFPPNATWGQSVAKVSFPLVFLWGRWEDPDHLMVTTATTDFTKSKVRDHHLTSAWWKSWFKPPGKLLPAQLKGWKVGSQNSFNQWCNKKELGPPKWAPTVFLKKSGAWILGSIFGRSRSWCSGLINGCHQWPVSFFQWFLTSNN